MSAPSNSPQPGLTDGSESAPSAGASKGRLVEQAVKFVAPSSLVERLDALRRRQVLISVLTGLSMTVVIGLELLALALFLDWWMELPWTVRLISLLVQIGVFGALTAQFILRPIWRQPDEDALALMVEKARPEYRGRLIAAVQLARPGAVPPEASFALAAALIEGTEEMVRPADFRSIVRLDSLKRFGILAIVIPLLAAAGFVYGHDVCTALLQRALLSNVPVPRKTRLVVPDGDRIVGVGDTLRLDVFAQGVIPGDGSVEVTYRGRRTQRFPLEQNRDNQIHFGRVIENVQDSFTYQFQLGDAVSRVYSITAVPRPTVSAISCEQIYPGYTGLKPSVRNLGDLALLAGSVLKLNITASKDLKAAAIQLVGLGRELPLALDEKHPRELAGVFTIPARGLTGFQIRMRDTQEMDSRDSAVYRVDILPDKVPMVRLTYPDRKEELVTRHATMLVGFDASDDFQIRKVRLRYKASTIENGVEKSTELDLGGESPQRLRRRYEWKLSETLPGLGEGSVIEYWVEAEDNNDATGPGFGASEHQLARVVSEAEKRADLLNRAGDYLGSITDVALDQEKLNQTLGNLIRAKSGLR